MSSLFPAIFDVIEKNPKKHQSLPKQIPTEGSSDTWDMFRLTPIDVPGALSFFLWNTDPMYAQGTQNLRKQILSEKILEIQGRIDAELSGRKWPRKKIADLVSAQLAAVDPNGSDLLEEALCHMLGFQKVVIKRKDKKISFFPSDIRTWRSDRPIFYGDDENRWHYELETPLNISMWVTTKEDEGWRIHWPMHEGKLEEIRAEMNKRSLVAHLAPGADPTSKIKKDDWARCLGRAEGVEALARLGIKVEGL
jgi:hypothetical protein